METPSSRVLAELCPKLRTLPKEELLQIVGGQGYNTPVSIITDDLADI